MLGLTFKKTLMSIRPFCMSQRVYTKELGNMPTGKATDDYFLEESEVVTRFMWIIHQFRLLDLKTLDWDKNFDDYNIDSLQQIAIITSVEHEFHTIFEDRIFENFRTFGAIKDYIVKDHNCF
jgi:NADH dehydrogenase (ubiquinone) 1 alpha/beta subcomplex 1